MEGVGSPKAAREPRPEGFVVARIAGEAEVHRAPHVLVEEGLSNHADPSTWGAGGGIVGEPVGGGPPVEASAPAAPEGGGDSEDLAPRAPAPPMDAAPPASPPQRHQRGATPWDEGLGELPSAYQDDTFLALPRDPTTLWLFWDFAPSTIEEARRDLVDPRVRLRLFDEGGLVREQDLALESRSFYLHDLAPGRSYRAELLVVGANGEHRIGSPTNQAALPPKGPSSIVDDRFATLPWGLPLGGDLDLLTHGVSLAGIPESERAALWAASRPGERLGGSESLGGGSQSGRPWVSSRER